MIWERINELKRREEQKARDETARKEAEAAEASIRAEREKAEWQKKRKEKHEHTDLVFRSSGVTEQMGKLEKGLEGNVRKHALIKDLDRGVMRLVWGNKFKITDSGEIDYEKPWRGVGVMDYSYIQAEVGNEDSIVIQCSSVKKNGWSWDKKAIQDLLAKAYLNPRRVNDRNPPSRGYSSSSTTGTTECCHQ